MNLISQRQARLIIVESPTKARTLSRFLGRNYAVEATVGHIKDLPKNNAKNNLSIDIEHDFKPLYQIVAGREATIKQITDKSRKVNKIYLATDPDREGEAIAEHIYEEIIKRGNVSKDKFDRITFHEITKEAVEEAITHPIKINKDLVRAQVARRVLDRLVGYILSNLIWQKVRYGLSAGRVQSAAMRIIMERERLIRAFIPEAFYIIHATFSAKGLTFDLICDSQPKEKTEADKIIQIGKSGKWKVVSIQETEVTRNPYPPFITSTLQRTASARYGFSPSRTMRAAQKLYEAGHITYMRTDSVAMNKPAQQSILALITRKFGEKYVHPRTYKTHSKNAQEAHECIRPTNFNLAETGNSPDERMLYSLIWKRTVASQMNPALIKRTKLSANVESGDIPNFSTTGSQIVFDGWLKVDQAARSEDTEVPALKMGDALNLKKIIREDKETEPPNRYTEAGLIKELETRGIGRPSTYASISNTIVSRGYVVKEGKTLFPTDTGDVVSSFLEEHFQDYISDTFTAKMEDDLDAIAKGEKEYVKVLSHFYKPFIKDVEAKKKVKKLTNLGPADKKFKCPKCGKEMVVKLGKTGKFLSCSTFPTCEGALSLDGKELSGGVTLGKHPDGQKILLLSGRFGPYVQLGEKTDENPNPRRASIPKGKNIDELTLNDAIKLLVLPRDLGIHEKSGEMVIANIGRFGPYVGYGREFRSLKKGDDPYTITLKRALEILNKPKAFPKGVDLMANLGKHPKTGKEILVLKSKTGLYLQKGLSRLYFDEADPKKITLEMAVELLK